MTENTANWMPVFFFTRSAGISRSLVVGGKAANSGLKPRCTGLGSCPIVRPHCNSNSVRLPSHRVPVKKALIQSAQCEVEDCVHVLPSRPGSQLATFSFTHGKVASRLSERVSDGPESASDCSTGPSSLTSLTRLSLV